MLKTLNTTWNAIRSPLSIVPDQTRNEYTNKSIIRLGIWYLAGVIVSNSIREFSLLGPNVVVNALFEWIILACAVGMVFTTLELLGNRSRRIARIEKAFEKEMKSKNKKK